MTTKSDIFLILAVGILALLVFGVFVYTITEMPKQRCEQLSVELEMPTKIGVGGCLVRVNGVWTPQYEVIYLLPELLDEK